MTGRADKEKSAAANDRGYSRVGIALGSNVGDRLRFLQYARDRIRVSQPNDFAQSSIYETAPVGCAPGTANFYNAVVEMESADLPNDLLKFLHAIERELGRPAKHPRNEARTIDLDLLYFGDTIIKSPALELPHPRLREREFVLRPLAEIALELRLPNQRATVAELLAAFSEEGAVKLVHEKW